MYLYHKKYLQFKPLGPYVNREDYMDPSQWM